MDDLHAKRSQRTTRTVAAWPHDTVEASGLRPMDSRFVPSRRVRHTARGFAFDGLTSRGSFEETTKPRVGDAHYLAVTEIADGVRGAGPGEGC